MLNCIDQHRFVAPNKWAVPEGGQAIAGLKALVNNPTPLADSGDEGLGRVTIPRHLSNRSLVQNWDASRAHSLGLD